jgi:hypothetical protein
MHQRAVPTRAPRARIRTAAMQARPRPTPAQPQAALGQPNAPGVTSLPNVAAAAPEETSRRSAYGLPCAKCGMYYEAALPACPICKSPERVAPRAIISQPGVLTSPTQSLPPVVPGSLEGIPDAAALEEERERFLHELKAQLDEGLAQRSSITASACARESVHGPGSDSSAAEICRDCYELLQESADRLEAALHMENAEAAKIIYDAVWADTSDPDRTYLNAAEALLQALRTRAGVSTPGAPSPYSH